MLLLVFVSFHLQVPFKSLWDHIQIERRLSLCTVAIHRLHFSVFLLAGCFLHAKDRIFTKKIAIAKTQTRIRICMSSLLAILFLFVGYSLCFGNVNSIYINIR